MAESPTAEPSDAGSPGTGLPPTALVLTQVAVPEALAAACALQRLDVDAVPTPIGCLAWCRDTSEGSPAAVAQAVSALLPGVPVLLLEHRDGRMRASRWASGQAGAEMSPALVLDGAPGVVEQLLLGQVTADALPGVVSSAGMSRWKATRTLAAISRQVRKAARGGGARA